MDGNVVCHARLYTWMCSNRKRTRQTSSDPPRFDKSAFGTVDLINDYQSLFKPAILATKPDGKVIACNNVAKVDRDAWYKSLVRCAEKQGRSVIEAVWLDPYSDFPSFDDNHPLKMVSLTIK